LKYEITFSHSRRKKEEAFEF